MAKTYLGTVKYEIQANYEVSGVVEKPDIVGAIFGQSEGLLGEDMDLKELQQNGKIGRIEITVKKGKGTTHGEIIIPSSLDRVKTSILAAAMETVEKVGPCEAKVKVNKIVDTRKEKREIITDRAQQLLKQMMKFEGAESGELAETIKAGVRTEKVINVDGMAAGPEVEESDSIIVVEGRADVLKLLSYGIKNAVEMNGSNISKSLIDLCKSKTVTVLTDGDRGGELNAKKLSQLTKVDFVASAPDGKEVEELTQKEILQALKKRRPAEEILGKEFRPYRETREGSYQREYEPRYGEERRYERPRNPYGHRGYDGGHERPYGRAHENRGYDRPFHSRERDNFGRGAPRHFDRRERRPHFGGDFRGGFRDQFFEPRPMPQYEAPQEIPKDILALKKDLNSLKGKLKARLFDEKKKKIKDVAVKEMLEALKKTKKKVDTIVFDGIITSRVIEAAEEKGVKNIVGVRKANVHSKTIKMYTL
ncbi:MAG: DNA primase DnaG [Candidatus Diapherotrites archaeon]|nr:DNA primase DnaG [Candidatus Diapherotrites archaeon]